MLGMALLIGFAFVCLVIVHDRLTNRLWRPPASASRRSQCAC